MFSVLSKAFGTKLSNLIKLPHRTFSSQQQIATALRNKKARSTSEQTKHFVDVKKVRTLGGNGGDGCISFLRLWSNENAGPDGGDGGNGAHVVFQASTDVNNLNHVQSVLKGEGGGKGETKDCCGKNANHLIIKVPIGTIIRNSLGKIVGDLNENGLMFVGARGGAGGKGNPFFVTDTEQAPEICEYGAQGEDLSYELELRSMAHIGLIGLPNAGKSTLLRAISRARPKVAPYPFTTLKPHLGMVQYDDYQQLAIADLPGLIPGSHKNKGLGIQFLKHAERCLALLFIIDVSNEDPWKHYDILRFELEQFSKELITRPQLIVANKIDLPDAKQNVEILRQKYNVPVIPISAKIGLNVGELLQHVRLMYDRFQIQQKNKEQNESKP